MTDAQYDEAIARHGRSIGRWRAVCVSACLVAAGAAVGAWAALAGVPEASAGQTARATTSVERVDGRETADGGQGDDGSAALTHALDLDQAAAAAFRDLSAVDGSAALATAGVDLNQMQRAALMRRIDDFAAQGYEASFAVVDMRDGSVIASHGGVARYTASAIKAPYVLALARTGAIDLPALAAGADADAAGLRQLVVSTLTVSDNDAYDALYRRFGIAPMSAYVAGTGAPADTTGYYADMSAIDLARLWVRGYQYLFGADGADAQARAWLASQMRGSLNSTIQQAHADGDDLVHSKGGWITGEGGLYAFNDGGIVLPAGASDLAAHPQGYVLTIMTNACGRDDLLSALAATVDEVMAGR